MSRRPALVRLLAVLASGAVVLGTAALGAAPADAGAGASIISTTLENHTKVTSTTGHGLKLQLVDYQSAGADTDIQLSLGDQDGDETHLWDFRLSGTISAIDPTGAGTVKATGSQMSGYGKLSVTSKPAGPKHVTASCGGDPLVAHRAVTVTGKLLIVTKSSGTHKWGSVGSASRTFHFSAHSRVTWDYFSDKSCGGGPLACSRYLDWQASHVGSGANYVSLTGGTNGKHYYLDGQRFTTLPRTGGNVTRSDFVYTNSQPLTLTVGSGGSAVLKIKASPDGPGSGGATIASPSTLMTSTNPCGTSGQSVRLKEWDGSWTNGAKPLRLPAQVFGAITMPDGATSARIDRSRVVSAP